MKNYPATLFLLGTSVAVQLLALVWPESTLLLSFRPHDGLTGWLGIVTYQVAHGGWAHLIGNFAFGLPFLLFLESKLGRRKTEEFFLLCGLCSAMFQYLIDCPPALVGSSGSIFGVMVGACMMFGETLEEHLLSLLFILCLFLPQLEVAPMEGLLGIAVYGHIGGAVCGLMLSGKKRYKA